MSDLIKRKDAIKAINQVGWLEDSEYEEKILAVPSADRPRGEWIEKSKTECKTIGSHSYTRCYCRRECSYCGYERDDNNPNKDTNFCPNCGCRMKGADNER